MAKREELKLQIIQIDGECSGINKEVSAECDAVRDRFLADHESLPDFNNL